MLLRSGHNIVAVTGFQPFVCHTNFLSEAVKQSVSVKNEELKIFRHPELGSGSDY